MTTRNPMNERYQNADDRAGKTRKSAASAKPVSKAASSVHVQGRPTEEPKGLWARATKQANKSAAVKESRKKAASKQQVERRREQALRSKYYNPDTPEYKKWRRIWWGMLIGAIASTAISFFFSTREGMTTPTYVFIALSYLLLILAIVLDFTYIRRLRNEYQDQMIAEEKSKKNSARRKEAAAEERRLAKEAEAAEQEPEEDRKLFSGLFTRKRASDAVATAKSAQARAAGVSEGDAADADDAVAEAAGAASASADAAEAAAEAATEAAAK